MVSDTPAGGGKIGNLFYSVGLIYPPADRVPVEGEGLGCDKGADCDDQGDVEHRRPHHAAHSNVVLSRHHETMKK